LTGRKLRPPPTSTRSQRRRARSVPGLPHAAEGAHVPKAWYTRKRGIWIINGYDDVRKALRGHEALSSAESQSRFRVHLPSINAVDPPGHTRLCRFVSPAFTPRPMTAWQAAINEFADELVDEMSACRRTEAVSELAKRCRRG
jgi:beta-dihydromenaquinone-9 omega-hydroxylase